MLLLAILLLFAAVGLLVAALVTGQAVLAWGSVGVSAVVVVALLALSRRSARRRREAAQADPDAVPDDEEPDDALGDAAQSSPQPHEPSSATAAEPLTAAEPPEGDGTSEFDETEPDEEDTDAADLLVVWELPDEVLVVDEHPRYHLTRCTWPAAAQTERLPVREARELGFTPCAACRPDASLARKHRAATAKQEAETPQTSRDAGSGGQDPDNSAIVG